MELADPAEAAQTLAPAAVQSYPVMNETAAPGGPAMPGGVAPALGGAQPGPAARASAEPPRPVTLTPTLPR